MSIRTYHEHALSLVTAVVEAVEPARLDLPTPCAEWSLRALLEHMIGQNHGFAASALGRGGELGAWADRPFGDRPAAAWAASTAELRAAFAGTKDDDPFLIPEIRDGGPFPAELAISFHYLDTLVHGWDVAAAIGSPLVVGPELGEAVLRVAERVPVDAEARAPGSQFRTPVEGAAEVSAFDRALALLGRDPAWRPARVLPG